MYEIFHIHHIIDSKINFIFIIWKKQIVDFYIFKNSFIFLKIYYLRFLIF